VSENRLEKTPHPTLSSIIERDTFLHPPNGEYKIVYVINKTSVFTVEQSNFPIGFNLNDTCQL